jgi:hypothetical protein
MRPDITPAPAKNQEEEEIFRLQEALKNLAEAWNARLILPTSH